MQIPPKVTERAFARLAEIKAAEQGQALRVAVEGGGAILNAYRFGGFLMFRLYPQERLMLDGRNDLYGDWRHDPYNRILTAGPGWRPSLEELVDRHDVRYILLDEAEPLIPALETDSRWVEWERREDGIVLLAREDSP